MVAANRVIPFVIPALFGLAAPLQTGSAAAQGSAEPQQLISIQQRKLTAKFHRRPLGLVVDELNQSGEVFIVAPEDMRDEPVSAELAGVPLAEGIQQMLHEHDLFFQYAGGKNPGTLKTVWIYRQGQARGLQPTAMEACASTQELRTNLTDADPEVRARAYEGLMDREESRAREAIISGIQSEGREDIRIRILQAAASHGIELPDSLLAEMASADASEHVRLMALDLLTGSPRLRDVVAAALTDPSAAVREKAKEIVDTVGPAQRPPKKSDP